MKASDFKRRDQEMANNHYTMGKMEDEMSVVVETLPKGLLHRDHLMFGYFTTRITENLIGGTSTFSAQCEPGKAMFKVWH